MACGLAFNFTGFVSPEVNFWGVRNSNCAPLATPTCARSKGDAGSIFFRDLSLEIGRRMIGIIVNKKNEIAGIGCNVNGSLLRGAKFYHVIISVLESAIFYAFVRFIGIRGKIAC